MDSCSVVRNLGVISVRWTDQCCGYILPSCPKNWKSLHVSVRLLSTSADVLNTLDTFGWAGRDNRSAIIWFEVLNCAVNCGRSIWLKHYGGLGRRCPGVSPLLPLAKKSKQTHPYLRHHSECLMVKNDWMMNSVIGRIILSLNSVEGRWLESSDVQFPVLYRLLRHLRDHLIHLCEI